MEDKASNLDAVLKEAVDLVRATLDPCPPSLTPRFACLFLLSRLLLGPRAVGVQRGAGRCCFALLGARFVPCLHPSFRGVFFWCAFSFARVRPDVWGFAVLVPCRLPLAVN